MKHMTFFAIMANYDTTEGRGSMFFTGVGFASKAEAIRFVKSDLFAKKWGVMGTHGSEYDVEEMSVAIYDTYGECEANLKTKFKADRRIAALAKLTDEDREVLGL